MDIKLEARNFSFSFIDDKGVKVTVEGMKTKSEAEKHIKKLMRWMKKEKYTIVDK